MNIKNELNSLIGKQIICANDTQLICQGKNGETVDISFYADNVDCGYAEVTRELFFEPNNKNNPVITDWEFAGGDRDNSCRVELTFFGLKKPLVKYDLECGSGSGWHYGAAITVVFDNLKEVRVCEW